MQTVPLPLAPDAGKKHFLYRAGPGETAADLESLEEQKKVWFSGITKETFVALQNSAAGSGQPIELALELDRPEWYEAYLSMESAVFFDAYFRKNQIPDPPLFHPDRL